MWNIKNNDGMVAEKSLKSKFMVHRISIFLKKDKNYHYASFYYVRTNGANILFKCYNIICRSLPKFLSYL